MGNPSNLPPCKYSRMTEANIKKNQNSGFNAFKSLLCISRCQQNLNCVICSSHESFWDISNHCWVGRVSIFTVERWGIWWVSSHFKSELHHLLTNFGKIGLNTHLCDPFAYWPSDVFPALPLLPFFFLIGGNYISQAPIGQKESVVPLCLM